MAPCKPQTSSYSLRSSRNRPPVSSSTAPKTSKDPIQDFEDIKFLANDDQTDKNMTIFRITAFDSPGDKLVQEDVWAFAYEPSKERNGGARYSFFGVFDGHAGRLAAVYAKDHLMNNIVSQKNFWANDDQLVLKSIYDGFVATHLQMLQVYETWPKTKSGFNSRAGTTASVAFIKQGKLYTGHVGDSAIVLGYQNENSRLWTARKLTTDHKPSDVEEEQRIIRSGGKVEPARDKKVPRVVWFKPAVRRNGRWRPAREMPCLAVSRSLGDFWSYNAQSNQFSVSPCPEVSVYNFDASRDKCLILGSDGLWNAVGIQVAVNAVYFGHINNKRQESLAEPGVQVSELKFWVSPAKKLVNKAKMGWSEKSKRADNISAIVVVFEQEDSLEGQVNETITVAAESSSSYSGGKEVIEIVTLSDDCNSSESEGEMDTAIANVADENSSDEPNRKMDTAAENVTDGVSTDEPGREMDTAAENVPDGVSTNEPDHEIDPVAENVPDGVSTNKPDHEIDPVAENVADGVISNDSQNEVEIIENNKEPASEPEVMIIEDELDLTPDCLGTLPKPAIYLKRYWGPSTVRLLGKVIHPRPRKFRIKKEKDVDENQAPPVTRSQKAAILTARQQSTNGGSSSASSEAQCDATLQRMKTEPGCD